ncbi:MAG: MarR family transcriptional regulator [Richelia sp. RM1_1_1]|nr:MarR family transcriptional regulator [Richelia sp. RM1_1_1]
MTHNTTKIQGKFYPLQHEEWLRDCRELTSAELQVLYYIRTLDPVNNGIEINAAEIARQLSSPQRQVRRQTVSRALKELVAKKYLPQKYSFISASADETFEEVES